MKDEALELALEALEEAWYHVGTFQPTEKAIDLYDEARAAIKEALAQPEEEKLHPVHIGVDVTREGTAVTAFYRKPDAVMEMFYSQFHPMAQPERYITDAMKVRQAVAQALLDDVYAEELEQPEAKQSGTISITTPAPIAYLCENATGHKYFRWKKPSSVYKPIPLYTTPPQRTWVGLTDEEIADCAEKMEASDPTDSFWREFFRGIEAKLKEKNT